VYMRIPVRVEGLAKNGSPFIEDTATSVVNAHGGLINLRAEVNHGQRLVLRNIATDEAVDAAVVFILQAKDDGFDVGVEFAIPNPSFWRVTFPPEDWSPSQTEAK
jgi:hypothetical protein